MSATPMPCPGCAATVTTDTETCWLCGYKIKPPAALVRANQTPGEDVVDSGAKTAATVLTMTLLGILGVLMLIVVVVVAAVALVIAICMSAYKP